jgi:large subunit ribosomal protein L4
METKVYNSKGKETGTINLSEAVFGLPWNADLVHQVVLSMQTDARTPVAHTKDRGQVRGGGKKPWRQKGTGRARHGSRRSPIWVGGGVTHGPNNKINFDRKVNKKMKAKALYTILSAKLRDGSIVFVDDLSFKAPKTKEAKTIVESLSKISGFEKLSTKKTNTAMIAISTKNQAVEKSFANFGNMAVDEIRNLNPVEVLKYKYLVIVNPEDGLKMIAGKLKK